MIRKGSECKQRSSRYLLWFLVYAKHARRHRVVYPRIPICQLCLTRLRTYLTLDEGKRRNGMS